MQAVKNDHLVSPAKSTNKIIPIGLVFIIILIVAIFANNVYQASRASSLPQGTVIVSQDVLEEKYGLHVNLVAVTGAGGFVDVRLKIVDGDKAKLLLADKKNFPSLFSKNGVILKAPEDTKSQEMKFDNGGNMFIMYPNAGNAVTQGSPVTILFGETALEPINAK
jgi:hypothetical protein